MNYLDEKQALDGITHHIDSLEREIRDFLCEISYYRAKKEEHPFESIFVTIKHNDFENQRQMLLIKIRYFENQLLDKVMHYDEILTNLHFVQYQLVQRSNILKDMLVASQTPGTTVQAIFDLMNAKYVTMDEWHKEFSKDFFEEVEKLQFEEEEKARIYINTIASKLSNALLKPGMHDSLNVATWKEESYDNYRDLGTVLNEVKSLQGDVQKAQATISRLQNRLSVIR